MTIFCCCRLSRLKVTSLQKFVIFAVSSLFFEEDTYTERGGRGRVRIRCDVRIIHSMFHSRPWHSRKFGTNIHNMATISHCYWQTLQFYFFSFFCYFATFYCVMCPIFTMELPSIHTRPNDWHANVKTKMPTSYTYTHTFTQI